MVSSSSARVLPRLLKSSHLTGVDSHSRFGTLDQQSRRLRLPRARLLALPGAGGWSSSIQRSSLTVGPLARSRRSPSQASGVTP